MVQIYPEFKIISRENKAHARIGKWAEKNGYGTLYDDENIKSFRLFGHDTDQNGDGYSNNGNINSQVNL